MNWKPITARKPGLHAKLMFSHVCLSTWGGVSVQGGLCQGDSPYGKERVVGIPLKCILVYSWSLLPPAMKLGQGNIFTARKRSLGQGNKFTGVCLSTGGRYLTCPRGGGTWPVRGGEYLTCPRGGEYLTCPQAWTHPPGLSTPPWD